MSLPTFRSSGRGCRWLRHVWRLTGCLVAGAQITAFAQARVRPLPTRTYTPVVVVPVVKKDQDKNNAYRSAPDLAADLRRVAVLPMSWEGSQSDFAQGSRSLEPILRAELLRTEKFEVVVVNPENLRRETGRLDWTGAEILPADFFATLRRVYGCDGVLFCELTAYHAYTPLTVGCRMKLVDAQSRQILWAADELFDSAVSGVLSKARVYHGGGQWVFRDQEESWRVENSPRLFGQYAIATSLSSLPGRKDMVKVSAPVADEPSRRQSQKNLPPTK